MSTDEDTPNGSFVVIASGAKRSSRQMPGEALGRGLRQPLRPASVLDRFAPLAMTKQERSSEPAFASMTNVLATALNALANASRDPVTESDILPILSTGDGPGHLVRALFGDCSFETLDRLGAALGVSRAALRASYAQAKRLHAASNAELEGEG